LDCWWIGGNCWGCFVQHDLFVHTIQVLSIIYMVCVLAQRSVVSVVAAGRDVTLDPDAGFNKQVRTVTSLMNPFFIGMGNMPISLFRDPDIDWRDRPHDPKRVLALAENILSTTLMPTHSVFVIVSNAIYREHSEDKFLFNSLVNRVEQMDVEVVQALAGNHTRLAIHSLFKRFRKNPNFHAVFGKLYLFPEMSEVFIWLRVRGKVDNRMLTMRKNTFIDDTQTLHYHALADVNRFGLKKISDLTTENLDALKSTFIASGHASGTVGSMWQLAKREGEIWELLEMIFQGHIESPNPKKRNIPVSGSKFARIGGVNDDTLKGLLEDIISGQSSLGMLNQNCIFYKMQFTVTTRFCKEIAKCIKAYNLDHQDDDEVTPIELIDVSKKANWVISWERVKTLVPAIALGGHVDRFAKVYITCPVKSQFGTDFKEFCKAQFIMAMLAGGQVCYLIIQF
jgi:hypothetical protein